MEQELSKCLFDRPVSHAEARRAAQNLIDAHFGNKDGKGVLISTPAKAGDDDVLLVDYIRQQEALSRPTQTADAVEALKDVLSAYTEYDQRLCCDGRECGCEAATLFDAIAHYFKAALSTSADSGDREEVKPATLEEALGRIQAAKRASAENAAASLVPPTPTPQDSGLADARPAQKGMGDELAEAVRTLFTEGIAAGVTRKLTNGERYIVQTLSSAQKQQENRDKRIRKSALRQPRNDGELLRDARVHLNHTALLTGNLEWKADLRNLVNRIDAALARLDQGEG